MLLSKDTLIKPYENTDNMYGLLLKRIRLNTINRFSKIYLKGYDQSMNDIQPSVLDEAEVHSFFKFGIRKFNEILTGNRLNEDINLIQIELIRDYFGETDYILELFLNDPKTLEENALKKSKIIKSEIQSVIEFLNVVLNNELVIKSDDLLNHLINDNHHYFQHALNIMMNHPLFSMNGDNQVEINQDVLMVIHQEHPIHRVIESNPVLKEINSRRSRNFVIFDNPNHQVIFDMYESDIKLKTKIPFSDFEHDTNRTFAEKVIAELLFDFESRKKHYIKLLSKNKKIYQREIDILSGFYTPSKDEVLVLLSILGRLQQQNDMGPIMTFRDEKLLPSKVLNHQTTLKYMESAVNTWVDFNSILLSNKTTLELPFGKFESIKKSIDDTDKIQHKFLIGMQAGLLPERKSSVSTNYIRGNVESPNYLESFFRKIVILPKYKNVIPYFDYETIKDLTKFSKRHRGPVEQKDFMIAAKMRGILMENSHDEMKASIHQVFEESRFNTYSKIVSEHLITFGDDMIRECYRLFFLFNHHIDMEKANFVNEKNEFELSSYNDSYLSIASDMHFNNFNYYEKSNFSNQFNIIAGDFADNLFHRANVALTGHMEISGVGVLGNHDIFLESTPTRDLRKEIKSNYKKSLQNINRHFPNIQILNDEIYYKDGYAIIGMTLLYDEHDGIRTFFANEDWGKMFSHDNYIERAKSLLNKVDKSVPIIFITHAPFKEYAVSLNKSIGVPSNWIFNDYPNVKVYIHGHGHSKSMKKKIKNILCITNPVIFTESIFEMSFSKEEVSRMLGLKQKSIRIDSTK